MKTRYHDRAPVVPWSGDVTEDFAARAAEGLEDREIGWIVEDFQTAGLDLGVRGAPQEEFIEQRRAQHRWYLSALADGLRLSPEQTTAAAGRLDELAEEAEADFLKSLEGAGGKFEHEGKSYQIIGSHVISRHVSASEWLTGDFMPWEISGLTKEQEQLTAKDQMDSTPPAEAIFPLLESQQISADAAILETARMLHPAQLKMLLLLKPETAGKLEAALAAGEKGSGPTDHPSGKTH